MEREDFIKANEKYNLFKKELKELFIKYNVSIKGHESYVQHNYAGTELYFMLDGECLYRETVEELITNL